MSILIPCPRCGANLTAPDESAGKQVRCPRAGCGAIVVLPAFLAVEEIEVVDAVKIQPKPVRAVEVERDDNRPRKKRRDYDDDDDDDRPRKKRREYDNDDDDRPRKRKKGGMGAGVIVAMVFGSLLVLGGVGFGVYALVSRDKGGASAEKKSDPPAGWKQFTYRKDKFKAYFPNEPSVSEMSGGRAPAGIGVMNLPSPATVYLPRDFGPGTKVAVVVTRVSPDPETQAESRRQFRDILLRQGLSAGSKTVKWLGVDADEFNSSEGASTRIAFVGQKMYLATINAINGARVSSDEVKGFFDNFELLK